MKERPGKLVSLLGMGAVVFALGLTSGCEEQELALGSRSQATMGTKSDSLGFEEYNLKHYSEISLYYPEVIDYKIIDAGIVKTEKTFTRWFNLTSTTFNPQVAAKTYAYFENLTVPVKRVVYQTDSQKIDFFLSPKPRNERVLFIIPEKAPPPYWLKPQGLDFYSSTTGTFPGIYVTFVRAFSEKTLPPSKIFTTPEAAINKSFAIANCHSSVRVGALTDELAELGQNIVCNSWGDAVSLKQMGIGYTQYWRWAMQVRISPDQKISFPVYVLSRQEYDEIPILGKVIEISRQLIY